MQSSGAIVGEEGVLNAGLYSPQNVAAVYREALRQAYILLTNGRSVILDGTWRDADRRDQVRQLAVQTHAAEIEFVCETPVATAARRVAARPAGSTSDATPQIAVALADVDEQWPQAHRIDTSRPIVDSVCTAAKLWLSAADDAEVQLATRDFGHIEWCPLAGSRPDDASLTSTMPEITARRPNTV